MAKKKFDVTMPIMAGVVGIGIFAVARMAMTKGSKPQTTAPDAGGFAKQASQGFSAGENVEVDIAKAGSIMLPPIQPDTIVTGTTGRVIVSVDAMVVPNDPNLLMFLGTPLAVQGNSGNLRDLAMDAPVDAARSFPIKGRPGKQVAIPRSAVVGNGFIPIRKS